MRKNYIFMGVLVAAAIIYLAFVTLKPQVLHGDTSMIKVTILYPNLPNKRFDFDYYLNKHMPLSIKLQGAGLKGVSIERGYDSELPGTSFEYVAICHLLYNSQEDFLAAFLPNAEVLQGDMPNYTDIEPIIQFSTVELTQ